MNDELHNLTVRLEPKSLFLVSRSYLEHFHSSSWQVQFDYLKITSVQPASNNNNNTTKIASAAGVIGALVFIGFILFWFFHRRRKRGVQVIEPHNSILLEDYPHGSGSPAVHISPFYERPQYKKLSNTGYDGGHEEVVLLVGAPATGDRKNKNKYSLYNAPEVSVSFQSLHNSQEPLVASTSAGVPSREPPLPSTMTTYATSLDSGIWESVRSSVTPNYTDGTSEVGEFQSAAFPQTAKATPPRPPRLTIPSSSTSPPIPPVLRQMSFYPPAITGVEISQMKMREQTLQTSPLVSPQPMTAVTMLPPYRSPIHASPVPPLPDPHAPQ